MKRIFTLLAVVLFCASLSINLVSCKKGDGDPFFSFYTRKARVTGDWKVKKLNSKLTYTNKVVETSYDGLHKVVTTTTHDSIINGIDSTYIELVSYTGEIITNYKKDGSYYYKDNFQDDYTGILINVEVNGNWYFMGGNNHDGYKDKELLAMQVTDYIYNPIVGGAYSTLYQGNNTLNVYEIYELKNKEIILKVNKSETINFILYVTTMEFTLSPG
jgi:hypothetical protein